MRPIPRLLRGTLATLALTTAAAAAADYAGTYRGDMRGRPSSIDLTPDGDGYAGMIHFGPDLLPCHAADRGDRLAGTIGGGTAPTPFTATLAGDTLTLTVGRATYTMTRAAAAGVTAGPAELARTASGRAVVFAAPATATTAAAALDAVLPGLARGVGADVTVTGRFTDAKHPDLGGATFTTAGDRPLRGVAFCGPSTAGGLDVAVAYAAADAPAAEWDALTAALPHRTALRPYALPDATATIGLPDGWTCHAQSALDAVIADGPGGQQVTIGVCVTVDGDQSPLVQMVRANQQAAAEAAAMARQVGLPPPAPMPPGAEADLLLGECDDPVVMLQRIFPQISRRSVAHGGPPQTLDRVLARTPAPAQLPGGRAALLTMLWSYGPPATAEHLREQMRIESASVGAGTGETLLCLSGLQARAADFDRCLPTLWAVSQSYRTDPARVAEVARARAAALAEAGQRQRAQYEADSRARRLSFDRDRAAHDEQAAEFDQFERTLNAQNTASHRAAADFAEMIGGYQKVVNTRTGEERRVDYYDAPAIVAALNAAAGDGSEWVAVHQRDERYPLTR